IDLDTTLGRLSSILDTGHFALIVHSQTQFSSKESMDLKQIVIGVVTRIDLLNFIANEQAKTAAHLFAMDAMRLSIRLWGILFHSSRSAISKSRTVAGGLGRAAMRRPSMPKHARLDSGQESTLAITYAVLFQLQACSPPDELYAVGHYHPGKQRNLQWLQRKG
ncbi:uncharacterized protein TNCV_1959481, partial [Trichonephila clavipes]